MLLRELPAAPSREVLVVVEVVAMVVQLLGRHQLFSAPRRNLVRSCLPEIEVYFDAQLISYILSVRSFQKGTPKICDDTRKWIFFPSIVIPALE